MRSLTVVTVVLVLAGAAPAHGQDTQPRSYRVLATKKTSTMEKEIKEAADAGYRFRAVMGGTTAWGGAEVVVVMEGTNSTEPRYEYRLLATTKTSTMQTELQQAAQAGFNYVGQTVFATAFGGEEVVCILERDRQDQARQHYDYRLLATNKTSTMQKELGELAEQGYEVVGLTVAPTALGGNELVAITRRSVGR